MNSRPDRRAWAASAAVHLLALLLIWWTETVQPAPEEFVAYEIELVSPPSPDRGMPSVEELTVETPEVEEPPPRVEEEQPPLPEPEEEEPAPVEEEEPEEAEEEPEEEQPEEPPVEERPQPEPPEEEEETGSPEPDPEAEPGGEDVNVRLEGVRRDYPEYYNNIIRQMQRCFRWRGESDLSATVRFYINRDGTVSDMSVVERSGDVEFDFEALAAVECAGRGARMGPLPEDLPFDRLPVEFTFRPAGGAR